MYYRTKLRLQHLLAISLVNGGIWALSKLLQFNVGIWFPKWWITLEQETKEKIYKKYNNIKYLKVLQVK